MTITYRRTVADEQGFMVWAASAPKGDTVTYHVGNLAADRVGRNDLHRMAEAALLFQETGWMVLSQLPLRSTTPLTCYFATRTGSGTAPRAVLLRQIPADEYRVLRTVRDRWSDLSAVRAIRDGLGYPEELAADYLSLLYARQFIQAAPDRGWEPSQTGLRMLM